MSAKEPNPKPQGFARPEQTVPPPRPVSQVSPSPPAQAAGVIRIGAWPAAVFLVLGVTIGGLGASAAYEHVGARLAAEVAEARIARDLLVTAGQAALAACAEAMPPTVAAQRQAMLEEIKKLREAPKGVGGN